MPEKLTIEILTLYGPMALGWVGFLFVSWRMMVDAKLNREALKEVLDAYHLVTIEDTKIMERLAVTIERIERSIVPIERLLVTLEERSRVGK